MVKNPPAMQEIQVQSLGEVTLGNAAPQHTPIPGPRTWTALLNGRITKGLESNVSVGKISSKFISFPKIEPWKSYRSWGECDFWFGCTRPPKKF